MNKFILLGLIFLISIFVGCDNSVTNTTSTGNTDSLVILNNLLLKDTLNAKLIASRANIYFKRGKLDPALRDLQAALKLAPNNPKLFLLLSDIYFVLGQSDNSIASLKKAIRLNPNTEIPYLKLSETFLLINKANVAVQYADEAINVNRQNPECYYVKAMALLETKDTASAILNFGISANLSDDKYLQYMQLGAIYTAKNDSLSKTNFAKALEAKPNDERALYYLGMYSQEHGDFEDAIKYFTTISEIYPDNKRVFYNLGYIYLVEMENFENAKSMFKEAIAISPTFVEAVYNLGRTYEAMGDYKNARVQYRQTLELLPNYPLAVSGMNRLDDIQFRQN